MDHGDMLRFLCPTCRNPVLVERSKIEQVAGINVMCPECKNISHVPGAFRTGKLPTDLKITGGVIVPIKEFGEWYFDHPIVNSLINKGQHEFLYEYGLYGFCSKCFHQYGSTILFMLPCEQDMKSQYTVFMAKTAESGEDLKSLLSGKCPSCGHDKMISIVTNIPIYVQEAIRVKKGKH